MAITIGLVIKKSRRFLSFPFEKNILNSLRQA